MNIFLKMRRAIYESFALPRFEREAIDGPWKSRITRQERARRKKRKAIAYASKRKNRKLAA